MGSYITITGWGYTWKDTNDQAREAFRRMARREAEALGKVLDAEDPEEQVDFETSTITLRFPLRGREE